MPVLELGFPVFLVTRNEKFTASGILRYEHELLNIPIQDYGEEYVKGYTDRFSSC